MTLTLAATPRSTVYREGTASLYRFRRAKSPSGAQPMAEAGVPILVVPSMINRWYVVDLRPNYSLIEALTESGRDVYCLDWGVPNDEDRYLEWEDVLKRLARAVRRIRRLRSEHSSLQSEHSSLQSEHSSLQSEHSSLQSEHSSLQSEHSKGADKVVLMGYCMGGVLSAIHSALQPDTVAGLINLLGPIDFSRGGALRTMVDERWFDPEAMTALGNLPAAQMQSGLVALRPTLDLVHWVRLVDTWHEPGALEGFGAMEAWTRDNVPIPGRAYVRYIRELYQQNRLFKGTHRVGGRTVDLSRITCPVLTVTASSDSICPHDAAVALNVCVGSSDTEILTVPGGHVGAVVGDDAAAVLYPGVIDWLARRFSLGLAAAA
jgi:polyhydroxyalkanoate synthase